MKPGLASLYVASEWIIRLGMLWYVPQRPATAAARTWLVLIFLVPWLGLGCYLIVGRIRVPEKRRQRQQRAADRVRAVLAAMKTPGATPRPALDTRDEPTAALVERLGGFAPIDGNRVELLAEYEGMVDRLIGDIDAARAEVHLLFYIFAADAIGGRVAAAIERAARRGVSCRVLMDALGSAQGLRKLGPGLRAGGSTWWPRCQWGRCAATQHARICAITARSPSSMVPLDTSDRRTWSAPSSSAATPTKN